ncbi:PAS domain-containing protein [Nocardioides sp.]|jgi:PAS domain-containing protein|uniref:PAS domain-containing protein n=1 Tax=Nocardioides sp. TaxID=35761 RepID=UPI00260CD842|nr:PAS domain-containing protein [Nocardioides sp.]
MLTPYGAALHALAQALVAGVLAFAPANRFEHDGLMPSSPVIDLLLSTCTFMTMHIALLRDERERAIDAERILRQEADAESRLFGHIFDAMSDGIMLFDTDGPMLRHNTAARHLFGRPLPAPDRKRSSYGRLRLGAPRVEDPGAAHRRDQPAAAAGRALAPRRDRLPRPPSHPPDRSPRLAGARPPRLRRSGGPRTSSTCRVAPRPPVFAWNECWRS